MKFSYYPATYADNSIDFKSAYFVAELRYYTGNWEAIASFYAQKRKPKAGTIVLALPLVIHHRRQRTSLDIADGFSFSSFDADVLVAIQDHYGSRGIPQNLTGTEQNLYLVYSAWRRENCWIQRNSVITKIQARAGQIDLSDNTVIPVYINIYPHLWQEAKHEKGSLYRHQQLSWHIQRLEGLRQ